MGLLLGQDAEVGEWVGRKVGASFFPPLTAIGIVDRYDKLAGGIVFHDWNGSNLELTIALDRPLVRGEIKGIRHYVFDQLRARRVTLRTLADNFSARRFLERHATLEAHLPRWFKDGDAVQYRVLEDDPRWLRWKVEI